MELNYSKLRKGFLKLRAIAHPLRIKLLEFIEEKGEINVTIIYKTLNLEQAVASQHLKILRDASLVITRRDGKKIFYSVNKANIKTMVDLVDKLEFKK